MNWPELNVALFHVRWRDRQSVWVRRTACPRTWVPGSQVHKDSLLKQSGYLTASLAACFNFIFGPDLPSSAGIGLGGIIGR